MNKENCVLNFVDEIILDIYSFQRFAGHINYLTKPNHLNPKLFQNVSMIYYFLSVLTFILPFRFSNT